MLLRDLPYLLQSVLFLSLLALSSLLFLLHLLLQLLLLPSSVMASSPFLTVQLLLYITYSTLTAALRPWSYRFMFDTRATHCPCQLKTGPVSSRHTHMSMVYTPLFTTGLMTVASRLFRMCGFFSYSNTTSPACTTFFLVEIKGFTTLALLNFMHLCTPSTDLNGMVFTPKSLILSPFAAAKFFVVIHFHLRQHLGRHDMPCSSCVHCGSDVHRNVFYLNGFPW